MKDTRMNGWLTGYAEQFRPAVRGFARTCNVFALAVLQRMDTIITLLGNDVRVRRYVEPLVFTGAGTKELEVPIGDEWKLSLLSVSAAATITIRSGGTLRFVKTFAGPDTIGPDASISAGPGAPISITSTGAAEVTLHITVTDSVRSQSARGAGEVRPPGLPSNSVGTEIERHWPGILTDTQESVNVN